MNNANNPWREALAPFARPSLGRSVLDLATSVVPYFALCVAMYMLLDVSYWLVLLVAIPASGFLLRTFIVFHDCTHGSFLPTKRGNHILGAIVGLIVFTPYISWRHSHAVHHATAGDLDRRGVGDVPTLTVEEYRSRSRGGRILYYLFRSPLMLFTIGPIFSLVVQPRLVSRDARPRIKRSVHITNAVLAATIVGICLLIGWQEYLLIQMPTIMLAGAAGVWLFYVQHQFEDAYWESNEGWAYADAALKGSSYLKLPQPLQFFTGNIGLHHVHHLSARVPNYYLQAAHDAVPILHEVPVLTFKDAVKSVRLKLWCPERGRLVTWAEAAQAPAAA